MFIYYVVSPLPTANAKGIIVSLAESLQLILKF